MKDSLKLLNVCASGLDTANKFHLKDEELFSKAHEINDLKEKIDFLKNNLDEKKPGYVKSKRFLALCVKDSEPELACNLLLSCSKHSLQDIENYMAFSQIAIEHGAWEVARSSLEAAMWLVSEKESEDLKKTKLLSELVLEKINNGIKDNSNNGFWKNKLLNKYWILERLYLKGKTNESVNYAYKLLKVFPDDLKNYEAVYKLFCLINDKKVIDDFIKYLQSNTSLDDENKNLYLAKAYYITGQYDLSTDLLLKVNPGNTKRAVYLSLCYLFKNEIKNFVECFNKVVPDSETITLALFFIHSALLNLKLKEKEFPNQKTISQEISRIIEKLFTNSMEKEVDYIMKELSKLN